MNNKAIAVIALAAAGLLAYYLYGRRKTAVADAIVQDATNKANNFVEQPPAIPSEEIFPDKIVKTFETQGTTIKPSMVISDGVQKTVTPLTIDNFVSEPMQTETVYMELPVL